jgi:hypothetical protein
VTFYIKDFIYNNGLVNLYDFLEKENFDVSKELTENYLFLKIDDERKDQIYIEILKNFFKDYNIVYQTDNDRWYFDENQQDFILDKKFDTVGGQKNDLRNGIYLYKNISEFNLTREEVEKKYLKFCEKFNLKPEKEPDGKLKVPNRKNEVIIAITLDKAIERFIKYFVKGEYLNLDSKIHTFEDGSVTFQSMLKLPKNYKINKWDALIYWFGGRVQRFYNFNYFIYPNSTDLLALELFKKELKIKDDKISIRDKNEKLKIINTNIDFYNQLSNDGIFNPNFYISKSEQEFELKFFMYLFSVIYHIEEQYKKANSRRKRLKEKLYNVLENITFVIYNDDGTFKTSLSEYTKAYKLIKFFEKLRETEDEETNLFTYLADILTTISLSQKNNETNLNLKKYCDAVLNFKNVRKLYYQISFNILKNDTKSFGKRLFDFESFYLNHILKGEMMDIHKLSKIIGNGIGYFCAELGDKDLLFKLRSIKNYKQLLSYFKDLKFAILKNEDKAKFSKEFNEALEEILQSLESNWEIVRDYIAIYAIDKYRASTYAKNQGGK